VEQPETGPQRIGIDTGAYTTGRLTILRLSDAGLHLIG
jgi:serine/threonine protein phosphatase 1